MFDKSQASFPVKEKFIFINSCGVSPLYKGALKAECDYAELQSKYGNLLFSIHSESLESLHSAFGELLRTAAGNISFVKSTAEGLSMIANGYPLMEGDEILNYVHEYPANHYPWRLQEFRGARLKLIPDADIRCGEADRKVVASRPLGFALEDIDKLVTPRTRIIAVSHVQFTSGFACDLPSLGAYCKDKGIDLVVDAAQSLGCMPIYPEEWNISAIASSGWKWLMGPLGAGILYTSPGFREKIRHNMTGADLMKQGNDYLNHTWDPVDSGQRFEYSTVPFSLAAGLDACLRQVFLRYGIENIWTEIKRLQTLALDALDRKKFVPLQFEKENRSGILSLIVKGDAERLAQAITNKGVVCTARGGYLRFAPHFYVDDEELLKAVETFNASMVLV